MTNTSMRNRCFLNESTHSSVFEVSDKRAHTLDRCFSEVLYSFSMQCALFWCVKNELVASCYAKLSSHCALWVVRKAAIVAQCLTEGTRVWKPEECLSSSLFFFCCATSLLSCATYSLERPPTCAYLSLRRRNLILTTPSGKDASLFILLAFLKIYF